MILTFSTILVMAPNCLSLPHSFTGIVCRLAGPYLASCTCACAFFSAEKVTELIWLPRPCACHRSVFPRHAMQRDSHQRSVHRFIDAANSARLGILLCFPEVEVTFDRGQKKGSLFGLQGYRHCHTHFGELLCWLLAQK
ncbi:uncharacterized protein F5891DRAFT_1065463 [Suillus fuscotomentosus]|uniref:Secreted protein n=1 Tax=Suillus fuscotomentosus TaxID=1912939 RepID=A0AAD4DW28_9AGAM|nr:uncharacterized protein F5891DRAFT_1065463 [Suillus fuscotomentosus]KAG1893673.1 hypothetical protein F5891DRAFT_1065463 [Suillus fuscotomentosus]